MSSPETAFPSLGSRLSYPTYFETLGTSHIVRLSIWTAVGAFSIAVSVLSFLRWHSPALAWTSTLLGIGILAAPLVMKAIYNILFTWLQLLPTFLKKDCGTTIDSGEYARQRIEHLKSSPTPRWLGFGGAGYAVAGFWWGGAFAQLPIAPRVIFGGVVVLAGFVAGVGITALAFLGRFIWRLGRYYRVRVSPHHFGVLSVGKMLMKSYALASIVWCIFSASAIRSLPRGWVPLLLLAAPSFMFFLVSFLVCQFPLHERMVEYKRSKLLDLDNRLEEVSARTEISADSERQIDFLVAEMKRVNQWPEWPFSIGNFSGVFAASLAAIAPQLIKIALVVYDFSGHKRA